MAIRHTRLARNVNSFKGTARELYKTIADHASPGPDRKRKEGRKPLPEGWTSIGYARMMMECNVTRVQTITNALKELHAAGAIQRKMIRGNSWWTQFDSKWAEAHQWEQADIDGFRKKSSMKLRAMLERKVAEGVVMPSDDYTRITTEPVVAHNGLQLKPLATTTENRGVAHSSELGSLSKREIDKAPAEQFLSIKSFKDKDQDEDQDNSDDQTSGISSLKPRDEEQSSPSPHAVKSLAPLPPRPALCKHGKPLGAICTICSAVSCGGKCAAHEKWHFECKECFPLGHNPEFEEIGAQDDAQRLRLRSRVSVPPARERMEFN